jgi:hypothetical protein
VVARIWIVGLLANGNVLGGFVERVCLPHVLDAFEPCAHDLRRRNAPRKTAYIESGRAETVKRDSADTVAKTRNERSQSGRIDCIDRVVVGIGVRMRVESRGSDIPHGLKKDEVAR